MDCIPQAPLFMGSPRQEYWSGFQPRDGTHVSSIFCIGRRILYHYTTWEVQVSYWSQVFKRLIKFLKSL